MSNLSLIERTELEIMISSVPPSPDLVDDAILAGNLNQPSPSQPSDLSHDLLQTASACLQVKSSTPALEVLRALGQGADYAVILCQQQFVGLITAKQIVKALAAGINLAECSVGSLNLSCVTLDYAELEDLLTVSQRFQQHQLQYLPVLKQQQVVGVVALEQVTAKLHQLLTNPAAIWVQPSFSAAPAESPAQPDLASDLLQWANVSHEMRASISGIAAFVELIASDRAVMQNYAEALDCIDQTCRYLIALTDDICLFAQLEANRSQPRQKTCNLHELLKDLKQRFQLQARTKQLEFALEQDGALPQYIITDPVKLRRILDNLLSNAIKFTQRGKITLKLTVQDQLYFEVKDTGVGIAPDEQASIFEPFVQAAAGRQSAQGVGLGLAISQKLAQIMGGEIWVSSILGRGTTVRLALPVQKRLLP